MKSPTCDCDVIHEEIVNKVKPMMPDSKEFFDLAQLYKVFSDSTRIQILYALTCSEMCVCDLAVLLDMTKSAISHQLKSLRLANLVQFRKEAQIAYYSIADNRVKDILDRGFEHNRE